MDSTRHLENEPAATVGDTPAGETAAAEGTRTPCDSYGRLFRRFLRFGCLAWGGPVAQIDMIRQEIVEEERWISRDQFKRILAIYQVLPGPEAHELCVHFGMLARGRIGGILAGLGFMLPGFILMFALSWLYLSFNLENTVFRAVFRGIQPAVIALIFRAAHRIGGHTVTDKTLWAIAILAGVADLLGVTFWIVLPLAGLAYLFAKKRQWLWLAVVGLAFLTASGALVTIAQRDQPAEPQQQTAAFSGQGTGDTGKASAGELFVSGLRGGLLTFGGAYTVIPFLQKDAVEKGQWMTKADFLDGLALSGTLPAPLIIFSTFVGYFGGGRLGALAMTIGIFLPAFAFSLLFYRRLEAVVENPNLHHFLEGVTAGVVGLIVATLFDLGRATLTNVWVWAIFAACLVPLYLWKSKTVIPLIIVGAGVVGWLVFAVLNG
jgi:chromate transporter